MKNVFFACWMFIFSTHLVAQKNDHFEEAITPAELSSMARVLPAGQLYSINLFREKSNDRLSLAALSSRKNSGWQLILVSPTGIDGYTVSWKSPRLDDSFAVSDPRNLGTYGLSDGEAIKFSGCARHQCPDIFSVLLYVPSLNQAFTATCENGKTSYSPANTKYKEPLDDLLRDQIGSKQACSADIHGEL